MTTASGKKRTFGEVCYPRCSTIGSLRLSKKIKTESLTTLKNTRRKRANLCSRQPTSWVICIPLQRASEEPYLVVLTTMSSLREITKMRKERRDRLTQRRRKRWESPSSSHKTSSSALSARSSSTSSISTILCASPRRLCCCFARGTNLTSQGLINCSQSWSRRRTKSTSNSKKKKSFKYRILKRKRDIRRATAKTTCSSWCLQWSSSAQTQVNSQVMPPWESSCYWTKSRTLCLNVRSWSKRCFTKLTSLVWSKSVFSFGRSCWDSNKTRKTTTLSEIKWTALTSRIAYLKTMENFTRCKRFAHRLASSFLWMFRDLSKTWDISSSQRC